MSVEAHSEQVARPMRRLKRLVRVRQLWRATLARFSSSLTRRIIVLNLGGLFALLLGFLYLNQFRAGLIDARLQSLQIQGEIIAAAIASSATVETDSIAIDPETVSATIRYGSTPKPAASISRIWFSGVCSTVETRA